MSKRYWPALAVLVACDGAPPDPVVALAPAPFRADPEWDHSAGAGAWCDGVERIEDARPLFASTVDPVRLLAAGTQVAARVGICETRLAWFDSSVGIEAVFDGRRVGPLAIRGYAMTQRDGVPQRSFDDTYNLGVAHIDGGGSTGRPVVIREGLPWDAIARHRHRATRAHLRIDPRRRWARVDADLVVDSDGASPLLFATVNPRHRADSDGNVQLGMRIAELTQDGEPRPRQWFGGYLAVQPAPRAGGVRLRLLTEGVPDLGTDDYLTVDSGRLARILPVIPGSAPTHDVTVEVPDGFEVVADGIAPASAPAGWRGYRVRGAAPFVASVRLARVASSTLALTGVTLDVDGTLDDAQITALRAMAARLATLAPPPQTTARVVVSAREFELEVMTTVDAPWIEVRGRPADSGTADTHAAYEAARALARWWLGGTVPTGDRRQVSWRNAVAAYLALGAVPPEAARTARRDFAAIGASLGWWRVSTGADIGVHDATRLTVRAALHLVALEDRAGSAMLERGLRDFVAARSGQPSRWEDLLAAMRAADADAGAWLTRTVEQPGAPRLTLDGVTRRGARIIGTLVQDRAGELPRFDGTVEVAALAGTSVVARVRVPYDDARTPFALDAAGADRIVIDPDFRLARRFDASTDPTLDHVAVELPAP